MDLREFVKSSLVEIADGVTDAQMELLGKGSTSAVNPAFKTIGEVNTMKARHHNWSEVQNVEFDVAVSASESKKADVGGKLSIVVASIDADKGVRSESGALNRIRFKVPMALPRGDRE